MKRIIVPVLMCLLAIVLFGSSHSLADPKSSLFGSIHQKLDTIQETLDDQVVPLVEETEPRIPISELPYTISEPGSYYLTSDLTTSSDGIIVNVDNVTIDLMGFSLIGPGSGTTYGIYMVGRKNVEIRNGTMTGFMASGIYEANNHEQPSPGMGHRVINVRLAGNGSGCILNGFGHLVKDCTVLENIGSYGIAVGKGSTVADNVCYNNGGRGISVYYSCTVTGNTCHDNNSNGIHADGGGSTIIGNTTYGNGNGILALSACTVMNNTSMDNRLSGIFARDDCQVKGNTLRNNAQNNIYLEQAGNSIEENLVTDSPNGIYFNSGGNFFANNRASGNTTNFNDPGGNTDGGGNISF